MITILAVGAPGPLVAEAIRSYERRASHYWRLDVREVRGPPARSMAPDDVRERDWRQLLDRAPPRTELCVCDATGASLTSEAFAAMLGAARDTGRETTFVVGGAHGLPRDALTSAARVLALAPWTLPHDLARLVLAEQIYRAGTILRGEPYHK